MALLARHEEPSLRSCVLVQLLIPFYRRRCLKYFKVVQNFEVVHFPLKAFGQEELRLWQRELRRLAGFQAAVPCCPAELPGHSPNTRHGSAGPVAKPPLRGGRAGVAVGLAVTLQLLLSIRAHLPQPSAVHL